MAVGSFPIRRGYAAGAVVVASLALAGGGCGRRGALESPPNATLVAPVTTPGGGARVRPVRTEQKTVPDPQSSATPVLSSTIDAPDDETLDANDTIAGVAPIPTPAAPGSRRRGRNFTIPKEPFILDPIL